jgi:quinol monooxygenase YgiN
VLIVVATFDLDPDLREAFLVGRCDSMRLSRAEPGCLEYTFSADPTDPRRVLLLERWASQEDLDAHVAGLQTRIPSASAAAAPTSKATSVVIYDVVEERRTG